MKRSRHLGAVALLVLLVSLAALLGVTSCESALAAEGDSLSTATVVRELVEQRTATSKTYLLSDGKKRSELFETPIHFKDAAGQWRDIVTTLVPAEAFGSWRGAATPVEVRFAAELAGEAPVSLAYDDTRITLNLLGTVEGSALALGDTVTYARVAPATDLAYELVEDGVKESLILTSSAAPSSFTFFVGHEGLALRQEASGQWGFYRAGESTPVLVMASLLVYDSSVSAAGEPAYCNAAQLRVTPAEGGSYVTYTVPKSWLTDAKRAWPVTIDPTITLGQSVCSDTYISSLYDTTAYGSATELKVGYYDSTTGWNRSLVRFDTAAVADTYVTAASFKAYQYHQYYTSTPMLTHIGRVTEYWSEASTWSSLADDGGLEFVEHGEQSVARGEWLDYWVRTLTQRWANGESGYPNYGFVIYQESGEGQSYWRKFRSSEYADAGERPRMVVDYEEPEATVSAPASGSAYRVGDTVRVTVDVSGTANASEITNIRMGVNRAAGDAERYRGVMAWFRSKPAAPWVSVKKAWNSYFAYYDSSAYGSDHVEALLSECSLDSTASPTEATFAFRIKDNYGDVQDNDFDTYLQMACGATSWTSGWVARNRDVDVQPKPLAGLEATDSPSDWFTETDADNDGAADSPNDTSDQGRGEVSLTWPAAPLAAGYQIYLWDGGAYQPVGRVLGNSSTSWGSGGLDLYPKDSEIAAAGWPGGASGNPFYRTATPDDPAQLALLQPSAYSGSAGLLAGDGSYLYARARSGQTGSAYWQRIDPATQAVTQFGPDLSAKPALSAFFHNGRVYSGYVTKSGTVGTITGVQTASPYGDGGTITFSSLPLERDTGAAVTASTADVLFACDGTTIYNIAYTLTTSGGVPLYDGFKIRSYTMTGELLDTTTLTMPSYKLSHVLVDGEALYLGEWSGANGARVLKLAKSDGAVINEWSEDQGTTRVCAGFWDATNHVFWLGHVSANQFYKYADASGGRDLRDNPNALYAVTDDTATSNDAETSYRFCVVPFVDAGTMPSVADPAAIADEQLPVTLENRTLGCNDERQHTTYSLGSWDGHTATAVLDERRLECDVVDLEVAAVGPRARLARTWTDGSGGGRWAPGWRFSFQRALTVTSTLITYSDERGVEHKFYKPSGATSWTTPRGYEGLLAEDGSTWTITYADDTKLVFDASGNLTEEVDRNGNRATYVWSGDDLTITSLADGESSGPAIVVHTASGQVVSASYATAAGTRTVTYSSGAPWRVTSFPGQACERTVEYGYDAGARLTEITHLAWPTSAASATEEFLYDASGELTGVHFPDYDAQAKPDARATISYPSATSATITRYGTVEGTANTAIAVETDTWQAETKCLISRKIAKIAGESDAAVTTTYGYGPDYKPVEVDAPDAGTLQAAYDEFGNVLATSDALGRQTARTFSYPAADPNGRLVAEEQPAQESYTEYDAAGNVAAETRQLNDSEWARTEYTYDSCGRLTYEKRLISGTVTHNQDGSFTVTDGVWAETDYDEGGYSVSGEPLTTINKAVKLSASGTPEDLPVVRTYDAFGQLLTETDTSGTLVVRTNVYDLAGRLVAETTAPHGGAASGATVHHTFDSLGNEIESWTVHASAPGIYVEWTRHFDGTLPNPTEYGYDAMGRATKEWHYLSQVQSPTVQLVSTVTHTYDGRGCETARDDSTVGGQPAKMLYDARGNLTTEWAEGVADYTASRATRHTLASGASAHDSQDRETATTEPGSSTATTYQYLDDGQLSREDNPDGSFTLYEYDTGGNRTSETTPLSGYDASTNPAAVAVTSSLYDAGGRLIWQQKPGGAATGTSYDLLDRVSTADGGSGPSTTTYNALGWVLTSVDASGVTVAKSYDTHGRVCSETVGSQGATATSYYDDGAVHVRTSPNGDVLTMSYDVFGNVTEEKHEDGASTVLKDVTTTYDSLNRPLTAAEAVSGRTQSWSYPLNTAGGVQETLSYDSSSLTATEISSNARGVETSRVTTIAANDTLTRAVSDSSGRDAADRWTSATLQESGQAALSLGRAFDEAGRISAQSGAGFTAAGSYGYDPDTGLMSTESLPLALGGTLSGSYSYDADGRLATATIGGVSGSYGFDTAGNLVSDTEGSTTTNFTYDVANRLTQSADGTTTILYDWDETNGWRTAQGPSGNPTQIQYTYMKNGASSSIGRLMRYQNAATSTDAIYTYDASGQRTKSTVTVGGTTTTTSFAYDGLTLLGLTATLGESSWRIDYLYDEEGAPYAGVYRDPAISTAPTAFTIITSDRGDVLELLDADGDAFAAYRYDAWGLPRGSGNYATGVWTQGTSLISSALAGQIASRQVLRYAGYAYDSESGLYYCSARYYDAATRQWTSADPAKADGEESAYQYCGGEPVGKVDPTGRWAERYIFNVKTSSFSVNMRWPFRFKWYCQAFAADLIWHRRESWWRWSYKGMGQTRIAVELYAHAVAYYSAAALNRLGIRHDYIAWLRRHASPADVNNDEVWYRVLVFYRVWRYVPG